MSAKSDALSLLLRARDEWAAGGLDHSLELLDAARCRLEGAGHSPESMPTTFDLIGRIRAHLLAIGEASA